MLDVAFAESLAQVDRGAWNALFTDEVEDYDYLLAIEQAGLEGFRLRYVLVHEEDLLVAAAPAFLMGYRLETTMAGAARRMAERVRRVTPGLFVLRLACIGSPCTERALIGLPQDAEPERRRALFKALVRGFEAAAGRHRCGLVALKDVAGDVLAMCSDEAASLGLRAVGSLPSADLPIDFPDLDRYYERLSASARKDMRRKLRTLGQVRVEMRTNVDDVLDRIMELYAETRARAEATFEALTPAYFQGVLRAMPGRAAVVLYYEGENLLAANLLIHDDRTLVDKYFCMEGSRGRDLNLYFLSWFTNVRLCLESGWTRYHAGQAAQDVKLRLGGRLTESAHYFRHRNPFWNVVLQALAPLFASDGAEAVA